MHEPVKSFRKEQQSLDLPHGNLFRRMLTAKAIAMVRKSRPEDVAAELWPSDRVLAVAIKAASAPAMTTVVGWAAELAAKVVADTVEALGGASAGIRLLGDALLLSWDGYGAITVPTFVGDANHGGFVAEGDPIPVRQFAGVGAILQPKKLASVAVLTREMLESSNAEALIGNSLIRSAGLALDAVLFGSAAASAAAPAGLRNGIATLPPSANTDPYFAFSEDVNNLLTAVSVVGGRGPFYLIGAPGKVASVFIHFPDNENQVIIPIMSSVMGNDLMAVAAPAIAAAISPDPEMETANAGTLVMDTAPVAAGTAGPERSLFQTDSLAIKLRWPVSWVLRDARGVAWTTPAWK